MKKYYYIILFLSLYTNLIYSAPKVIKISPEIEDVALYIQQEVKNIESQNIKIVFEKGTYLCNPDYAFEKYCAITNHGNGIKKIIFPLEGYKSVEIEGNGATLLCHGQVFPFLFESCNSVKVSDLTINWDIPFTFLGEVINVDSIEGWREIKPYREGFSWKLRNGELRFPMIDGFYYPQLGSTLAFDKNVKRVVHGAIDIESNPVKVEKLKNGNLRFYEKLKYYPPVGSLLSSKGDRQNDRYAPAFDFKECKNILLDNITIHHALGMAFLFERSEDITIRNSKVLLQEGTKRVISSTADATHFANCKGDILLENCVFENMLDDGVNVHGTYVEVDKVIDNKTVRVALKHFEQKGFKFADVGDEIWFLISPSVDRVETNKVSAVNLINETYIDLTFESVLPKGLKTGDILENKTWNPTFTMRKCTVQNNRARSIVLKTPLRIVIEDNYFSSMMSAIFLRGESVFWYESGAVTDVLIKGNYFKNCADCGTKHSVLYISPRLGKNFDSTQIYDSNINFVNNTIDTFNSRIVWADRVENLLIEGNIIKRNNERTPVFGDDAMFEFVNCKNVNIKGNKYYGQKHKQILKVDSNTKESLSVSGNENLKF